MYRAKKTLIVGDGIKILPGQTVVGVAPDEIPGLLQTHSIEYIPDPDFVVPKVDMHSGGVGGIDDPDDEDDIDDPDDAINTTLSESEIKKYDRMNKTDLLAVCMENGIYDLSEENSKSEIIAELGKAGVHPVKDNGTT